MIYSVVTSHIKYRHNQIEIHIDIHLNQLELDGKNASANRCDEFSHFYLSILKACIIDFNITANQKYKQRMVGKELCECLADLVGKSN